MRVALPRYPVDRYLTVNDKSFDMVNIIGEDLWKAEPALKPEDEIILKKLQDMLYTITEDLQNISKELSTNNEPGYRIKTQPLPQDEAFNTQVHVEEVVDAKFFGQKLIDKSTRSPIKKIDNDKNMKLVNKPKNQKTNTTVKVNAENRKKLTMSQAQVICIESNEKEQKLTKQIKNPRSSCTEFHFTHVPKETEKKHQLDVQHMPSINIRSELKEQNVLHLDISPKEETCQDVVNKNNNIAVVQIEHHENVTIPKARRLCRKISKLSTYESSESTTQSKSSQLAVKHKNKDINKYKKKTTTRPAFRNELKNERQTEEPFDSNIANWRRKLNLVYASKSRPQSSYRKPSELKTTKLKQKNKSVQLSDYIPYSKLTLGGVNLRDIENEAPSSSLKDDLPLAPIIDKILSSRENSPRKNSKGGGILSISDENLLKEVLGLETEVTKTLTKVKVQSTQKKQKDITNPVPVKEPNTQKTENSEKSCDSYEDDFEDEKSNSETEDSNKNINESQQIKNTSSRESINKDEINVTLDKTNEDNLEINENDSKAQLPQQNIPNVKTTNLSFKNSIDIFEFVHSVPMQDTETQSHVTNKFTLKEAETSPRSVLSEPLKENKIESTLDPGNEVSNVLQKEKDFIKNLILEEYGDLIKQNLSKPSGSNEKRHDFHRKNISAYQKNTQTSPARAKSVMTSPKHTKTRPTSPIQLNITVDKQTSAKVSKISSISDDSESEKLDITINLSSPRFSLRLPSTSGEVLSNLELFGHSRRSKKDSSLNLIALNKKEIRRTNRKSISSSTSFEASSSEISSVGEVTFKFKRRMRRNRLEDLSETSIFSNSSSESLSGDIIPLRSEGEIIPRQQRTGRPNNMRQL